MSEAKQQTADVDLDQLVAEADTGGRHAAGVAGHVLLWTAVAWSLFQLWYASPLSFMLGFGILNDTKARAIHLGFALFLTYIAYPAMRSSSRESVPPLDWILALVGAFAGSYLFLFHDALATRPGLPTTFDLVTGTVGIVLLLEATRRALGLPMVLVASVFIFYTFAGQHMPDVIQHRGASLVKFLNHQWLTTEGVFGIALGVSTSFVFLFVLFGTLLERAGAGNWMMQISIALLGHLRGGPAKVAVISSALNGVVSGSSVSNVVSGGMYTQALRPGDLMSDDDDYNPKTFYARSKRAQVVLTEQLATRLAGTGIVVHSMHPGWADTAGIQHAMPVFRRVVGPILRDGEEGADTIVWLGAAAEPLQSTGKLWMDRRVRPTHYRFGADEDSVETREELWDLCSRLAAAVA